MDQYLIVPIILLASLCILSYIYKIISAKKQSWEYENKAYPLEHFGMDSVKAVAKLMSRDWQSNTFRKGQLTLKEWEDAVQATNEAARVINHQSDCYASRRLHK